MRVSEVMSKLASCCRPEDTLNDAARWMWEKDCGTVPVVDGAGHVVGMLTDRDICMAGYTTGRALCDLDVEHAMSQRVVGCIAEQSLEAAIELMAENQVRRLPVLDRDGKLQGIVSLTDIARAPERMSGGERRALREKVAESLAHITEHRPARAAMARSGSAPAAASTASKAADPQATL